MSGVEHLSRTGDRYFLHAGKGRGRAAKYFFSRKPPEVPVAAVPEGYEVYESPERGQVHLRRVRPTPVLAPERERVAAAIRSRAGLTHFIVDVDGPGIIVYLPVTDRDDVDGWLRHAGAAGPRRRAVVEQMLRRCRYEKMMRYTLIDEAARLFNAERWCFLGGIDDWIFLDGSAPLADLLERYAGHLGKESFFDLT